MDRSPPPIRPNSSQNPKSTNQSNSISYSVSSSITVQWLRLTAMEVWCRGGKERWRDLSYPGASRVAMVAKHNKLHNNMWESRLCRSWRARSIRRLSCISHPWQYIYHLRHIHQQCNLSEYYWIDQMKSRNISTREINSSHVVLYDTSQTYINKRV